jgi:hypothetical protein
MQESKKLFLFTKKTDTKRQGSVLLGLLLLWAVLFFPIAASASDKFSPNDTLPPAPRRGAGAVELQDTLPVQPLPLVTPEQEIRDTQTQREPVRIRETRPEKEEITKEKHSPLKATMLSATLPGLGQAYNGRYWKIPIVYAGFGAVAYAVRFNNTEYQAFRRAYVARVDGNPNTVVDENLDVYSTDQLQRATNFYRRNLEITYILGAALYVLNILDATVDAHLLDFDVGEDLSMKLHPVVFPGVNPTNAGLNSFAGLRFTFRF